MILLLTACLATWGGWSEPKGGPDTAAPTTPTGTTPPGTTPTGTTDPFTSPLTPRPGFGLVVGEEGCRVQFVATSVAASSYACPDCPFGMPWQRELDFELDREASGVSDCTVVSTPGYGWLYDPDTVAMYWWSERFYLEQALDQYYDIWSWIDDYGGAEAAVVGYRQYGRFVPYLVLPGAWDRDSGFFWFNFAPYYYDDLVYESPVFGWGNVTP